MDDRGRSCGLGAHGERRAQLMRRGEIRLVDLDPVRGSEANKRRPAVIVSNDGANSTAARLGRGVVTVVPVTSSTDRVYPFQVLLPASGTGLDRDSKAQAEQVKSGSRRARRRAGRRSSARDPRLPGRSAEAASSPVGEPMARRARRRGRVGLRELVHYLGTCQALRPAWYFELERALGRIRSGAVVDPTVDAPGAPSMAS